MKRVAVLLLLVSCGSDPVAPAETPKPQLKSPAIAALPEEKHLADLRQITLAGENAEAYWSWDGKQLILQKREGDKDCDRIYRVFPFGQDIPALIPVSSGEGVTTCSYFMPGDQQVIYASTHLGGKACPP